MAVEGHAAVQAAGHAAEGAANAAAHAGPSAGEYIVHHLTHWRNKELVGPFDLSVVNYDSMIFSILVGVIGCFVLWKAASKATSGVPGRFQAAVEILVEMVENQAKGIVHNAKSRKHIGGTAPDAVRAAVAQGRTSLGL